MIHVQKTEKFAKFAVNLPATLAIHNRTWYLVLSRRSARIHEKMGTVFDTFKTCQVVNYA